MEYRFTLLCSDKFMKSFSIIHCLSLTQKLSGGRLTIDCRPVRRPASLLLLIVYRKIFAREKMQQIISFNSGLAGIRLNWDYVNFGFYFIAQIAKKLHSRCYHTMHSVINSNFLLMKPHPNFFELASELSSK